MRLLFIFAKKKINIWQRFNQIVLLIYNIDILRISHSYTGLYFISFWIV